MLKWHQTSEDRYMAVHAPVTFAIKRLERSARWMLVVGPTNKRGMPTDIVGSLHNHLRDAEQAAERIAEMHADTARMAQDARKVAQG